MNALALIASGAIMLAFIPSVLGHGYITDPVATWKDGYAVNGWGSSIDSNMWGTIDNSVYGYGRSATVAFFEAEFNASGYNSLSCIATKSTSNAATPSMINFDDRRGFHCC